MQRLRDRLIAILATIMVVFCVPASAKTLRVVTDNNYPPFLFLGAHGKPEGYVVDLWRLWQQKTGIRVDLEAMQWAAAQDAIQRGQADVIDMIFDTPERAKLYRFGPAYATQRVSIYVDPSIRGIRSVSSLSGFQIGVERGDACVEKLHSLGINTLSLYPNYTAIIDAAKAGAIKMFCMDDDPANYYLYLAGDQSRFGKAFTLYSNRFHWAVRPDDNATFALVAAGMRQITPAERAALRRKWFTYPFQYRPYMRDAAILAFSAWALLIMLAIWIWILRRMVRASTSKLQLQNLVLERQARDLALEEARLRTLFESSPDAMWLKDAAGVFIDCNTRATALLGRTRSELIGHADEDMTCDAVLVAQMQAMFQRVWDTGDEQHAEVTTTGTDGSTRHLDVIKVPIRAADHRIAGVLALARDITERRHAEDELRIAAVAFESQDGAIITDRAGIVQRVNTAFTRISGFTLEDAIGRTPQHLLRSGLHGAQFYADMRDAFSGEGTWTGDVWCRNKADGLFRARITVSAVHDQQGAVRHFVVNLHDITAETVATTRAEQLASFDLLTNLPNRNVLEERITEATLQAGTDGQSCCAVMLIDLDDFARINTVYGRSIGDRLLQQAAHRMQEVIPEGGILARSNGDEFALLITNLHRDAKEATREAGKRAQALHSVLGRPYNITDIEGLNCTASIGVTVLGRHHRSAATLLQEAELALLAAKAAGNNAVRMFATEMQRKMDARNALANQLRAGLAAGQFALHYQPQVDQTGIVISAEALLRWHQPGRGNIPPAEFIPVAEHTGLIEELGGWVLREACRQLAQWASVPAARHLILGVNVSPRQFRQGDFVEQVAAALIAAGANPKLLQLEITESMVMEDIDDAAAKIGALQKRGVRMSLDDFGTGRSSLSYLTRLPLDQLKIDQSFVRNLSVTNRDALVAKTIIAMAHGMGLEVVAEGVETEAQFRFLSDQYCNLYQGNLFAPAMPREAFEAAVQARVIVPGQSGDTEMIGARPM